MAELRKQEGLSVGDIQRRMAAEGMPVGATTVQRILKQAGFAKLKRRSRQERMAAAEPPPGRPSPDPPANRPRAPPKPEAGS